MASPSISKAVQIPVADFVHFEVVSLVDECIQPISDPLCSVEIDSFRQLSSEYSALINHHYLEQQAQI